MYRTTIEAGPEGVTVAREFSVNPDTSPYLLRDICRNPECDHAKRMLEHAKLVPLVFSDEIGLTFFLSEVK